MTLPTVRAWADRILLAQSEAAVIDFVREYLATWTPSEIGEIPRETWPGLEISTKAEVCDAAVQAKLEELRHPSDSVAAENLQELGQVLAVAVTRFGQLGSPFRARSE